MRELLFSQLWEKTNILVSTRIAFLRRELLLGKSTKNSLNLLQTRITQRKVILVCIVRESLILVCFLGENYIKPRRELSFSLLENDNSRLNIVILPLIRGENHVIRGTITVSNRVKFVGYIKIVMTLFQARNTFAKIPTPLIRKNVLSCQMTDPRRSGW